MEKQNNKNNQLTKEQQVLLMETLNDYLVIFFDINEEYTDWTVEDYNRVGQQMLLLNQMWYNMDLETSVNRCALDGRTIFEEELWDIDYSFSSEGRIIGTCYYDHNDGHLIEKQNITPDENMTEYHIEFDMDFEQIKQLGFPDTVIYGRNERFEGWPCLIYFTTDFLKDMYQAHIENNDK
jgi:hypothetical protein